MQLVVTEESKSLSQALKVLFPVLAVQDDTVNVDQGAQQVFEHRA